MPPGDVGRHGMRQSQPAFVPRYPINEGRGMSNRFIICGTSRSGKSVLARRLQRKLEISWILGDAMMSGLEDAFPDLGISHRGDLQHIGDRLTDILI